MTKRYFVPNLLAQAPTVALSAAESLHAAKVMRSQVGDTIELFDGEGHQCDAELVTVSPKQCICSCQTPQTVDREPTRSLSLAIAMPRPERAKEMVERLTELGVDQLWPLRCERTQRDPPGSLAAKLDRIVVEACKQSGRNRRMKVHPLEPLSAFLSRFTREADTGDASLAPIPSLRWVAVPGGESIGQRLREAGPSNSGLPTPDRCTAVIGPEGGLTEGEARSLRQADFVAVDLGKRILRVETAAVALACRWLTD